MQRRDFIAGLGAAITPVVRPLVASAQQPGVPVIGFLDTSSLEATKGVVSDFRRGLQDAGFIDGQNVAIEFRWGNNQPDMAQLARDLVRLQVAVIVASGGISSALAAKAATSIIPIVLAGGADPVKWGLVESLNRPGGNITGMTFTFNELAGKRLDLLVKLVPEATTIGYLTYGLVNEAEQRNTDELLAAARILGRHVIVLKCRVVDDFDSAFAALAEHQAGALIVSAFPLAFNNRRKILALAASQKLPAIYPQNQFVYGGGLMSYAAGRGALRQVAIQYVARILKGEKPADLPIQQPTNFELLINLKTASTLGLSIPPDLLAVADKVIE